MRRVYTLDFHFDHSLEELWPILIDTAHLNEATGFPRHSVTQTARPDGSVERIARGKFGPFNSEWEEIPWEWEDKHQISNVRRFRREFLSRSPPISNCSRRAMAAVCTVSLAWRAAT